MGKPEHPVAWGGPEDRGRRNEKCQCTKVGPTTWKPTVLIGVPLNGKVLEDSGVISLNDLRVAVEVREKLS